ncbi:hypothetical protein [Ulvibacterium marinum]|uniref:Periplasmic heavy metal sensor n=1 Tax=Ulvibacterium marinum TaxID=2419782 RepID=A0A3B0BWW9_9FLAO|nr:hypothetical protein [Ulvibacterium marinum]RKN77945.1 hypothetical protein D7Z94_22260 [Ulvibacterium marinum]
MKRETRYKIIIGALLIINVVQVSSLILTKRPQKHLREHRKPDAKEMLRLDDEQNIQFKTFSREHHKSMVSLKKEQKKYVRSYFLQPSDSLLKRIKDVEEKKILATEKHFNDLKSVLHEEQLPAYEDFKERALRYVLR